MNTYSPPLNISDNIPFYKKFKFKLYGLVILSLIFFLGYEVYDISSDKQTLYSGEQERLAYINHEFVSLLSFYETRVKSGELTREDARARAFNIVEQMQQTQIKEATNNPGTFSILPNTSIIDVKTGNFLVHVHTPLKGKNAFAQMTSDAPDPMAAQQQALTERLQNMRKHPDRTIYESIDRFSITSEEYETSLSVFTLYEEWDIILLTSTWMSDIDSRIEEDVIFSMIIVAAIAIMLLVSSVLIIRSVTQQIGGEPLEAIRAMRQVADGNLTITIQNSAKDSLLDTLRQMVGELRRMIQQIREGSHDINQNAQQIYSSSQKVAEAAATQTAQTTEMAAAIEELTVSVAQISDSSNNTQQLSSDVAALCHSSGELVNNSSIGMQRISDTMQDASKKIGLLQQQTDEISAITASIKEIADQTNLLALNAAIEAARAGDQGRGFSVVADEVRKLAERTSIATKEIDEMVRTVQLETRESTQAMSHIHPLITEGTDDSAKVVAALEEINNRANQSLELVTEVAHAAKEQSEASQTIAMKVEHISRMVEETQSVINATNLSVQQLRDVSNRLDELTNQFKV